MKKHIIKRIEEEAARLPIKIVTKPHTQYFSGEEAAQAAIKFGKPELAGKLRRQRSLPSKTPLASEFNHAAHMKNLYKTGGWPAVQEYIDGFVVSKGDGEAVG